MKIDELIQELEQIRKEHGNLEVQVPYDHNIHRNPIRPNKVKAFPPIKGQAKHVSLKEII